MAGPDRHRRLAPRCHSSHITAGERRVTNALLARRHAVGIHRVGDDLAAIPTTAAHSLAQATGRARGNLMKANPRGTEQRHFARRGDYATRYTISPPVCAGRPQSVCAFPGRRPPDINRPGAKADPARGPLFAYRGVPPAAARSAAASSRRMRHQSCHLSAHPTTFSKVTATVTSVVSVTSTTHGTAATSVATLAPHMRRTTCRAALARSRGRAIQDPS